MECLGYSAVVIGFLVGLVGVAIALRRFWIEMLRDEGSDHYNVMVDWLGSGRDIRRLHHRGSP